MDFSAMEFAELIDLSAKVDAEIKRREAEEKSKAKKQILELARIHGLDVNDLFNRVGQTKERAPVAVKYRHPENNELTWTGRGRKPAWVQAWIDSGKSLDSLLV